MTETKDTKTHFGYQTVGLAEKTQRVAEVFDSVAKRYDVMNDLMSMGLHRYWKRLALARCALQDGQTVLDLAGGTGDLSILLAGTKKASNIVLADINGSMLGEARAKLLDKGIQDPVTFLQTSAESLPFFNNSFHCILIAFGLRNVTLKDRALFEMYRVLRPGGRVVILEFSQPKDLFLKRLYDAYSFSILPFLGKIICDDAASYRYLAESIRMHPTPDALKAMMETAGFESVSYQNIHKGIVALHVGYKY